MRMHRFIGCLLSLSMVPAAASAVTINYANLNHLRTAYFPNAVHPLTTTTLDPDLANPSAGPILLTDPSAGFMTAMTNSLASNDWWGGPIVTFNWVGSLTGVFFIDVYRAMANNGFGAAQLLLHYERGVTDPAAADLFWIQTVETSRRGNNVPATEVIPYADVYASGYGAGAKLPFYFRPDETVLDANPYVGAANIRSGNYTVNGNNYNYDMAFWDQPSRPNNNYWKGELFLAYYDQPGKYVQILDGVSWGFNVVPEPPAYLLFGFGLMVLAAMRFRPTQRLT